MTLSPLDKTLIDLHFQSAELSRSYSPSGIYARVQHFIDNGLDEARQRHDAECEMRDGFRHWCACQERRGYTYERLPGGSVAMHPNPALTQLRPR